MRSGAAGGMQFHGHMATDQPVRSMRLRSEQAMAGHTRRFFPPHRQTPVEFYTWAGYEPFVSSTPHSSSFITEIKPQPPLTIPPKRARLGGRGRGVLGPAEDQLPLRTFSHQTLGVSSTAAEAPELKKLCL
jgi:hypothetical protein